MINKLEPGDRQLSASSWNEMRDRINDIVPSQDTVLTGNKNPFLITIKNNTGSNLDSLSVVKLDTATYTRTGSTFANKGIECGTELNGVAPASESDNVAILQGACPTGGFIKAIANGCTPAFIYKDSNKSYQFAKPVANQTGYLKGTDDPTNIKVLWVASGTGKKEAYVCLDATGTPEPEYFLINPGNNGSQTAANDYSLYTKGSLHYIQYNTAYSAWVPASGNESTSAGSFHGRPTGTRLVVCQCDAPNSAAEFKMPYFTPESNLGVPPLITTYNHGYMGDRCGCLLGEHVFSNSSFDYMITGIDGGNGSVTANTGLTFAYQPRFMEQVEADGYTGGGHTPNANVFGQIWDVLVPVPADGLSQMNHPDIYPGDLILVLVDLEAQQCWGLDYPTDYAENTTIASYNPPAGRGWTLVTTPQNVSDAGFMLYEKNKTGAIT